MTKWWVLALLAWLGLGGAAHADIFFSEDIALMRGEAANSYELAVTLPESIAEPAPVVLPAGCRQTALIRQPDGARVHYAISFACAHAFRADDVIRTPWKADGARYTSNVSSDPIDDQVERSLAGTGEGIVIPVGETAAGTRPLGEIAVDYLRQGMWHIWLGWDHLCFVSCLALLARGRGLLSLVTAFTVGHSISLALAFFDVVRAPIPPVEAGIALSIVFMAREALQVLEGHSHPSFRRNMAVVAGFGLLHGLGFATALRELGVAPGERAGALVFFNLGVEIGQLVFVAALLAMLAGLRQIPRKVRGRPFEQAARIAMLYGVGIVGAWWVFDRVLAFGSA
ncbi:HupE/UreJ family protein [Novosphingobium nitrogenifigens]|nr:HupE/UreJ family protein [Novosphingobium nitrogenifigens]